MMRKLLLFGCVVLMCSSVAYGGNLLNKRLVDMGDLDGYLLRPYGISDDPYMWSGDTDDSPTVTGANLWSGAGTQAFAYTTTGGFVQLKDSTGATGDNAWDRAFHVSKDGTEITGVAGAAAGNLVATSSDGWATHSTIAMTGSAPAWNAGKIALETGEVGANISGGGAGIWASKGAGTYTTIAGFNDTTQGSAFMDLSANGNYVLGATGSGTTATFAVYDRAGASTLSLPAESGYYIEDIKGISHDGKYVIGTRRGGNAVATGLTTTRAAYIWELSGGSYSLVNTFATLGGCAAGLSEYEHPTNGIAFMYTQSAKTYNGVVGTHAYLAYEHTMDHPTAGRALTIGESAMLLAYHMDWAGLDPMSILGTGQYYTWNDTVQSATNGATLTGGILGGTVEEGFFVTMPEPAVLSMLLLGLPMLIRRRR